MINKDAHISHEVLSYLIQKTRQRYQIPAIAVCIMNSSEILHQEIQGTRIANKNNPASLEDYFHIGSCSKSVLALIATKLIEQNKITWQTRFFTVYPELKDKARLEYQDITLEDLFLCEAGILPYTSGEERFPDISPSEPSPRLAFIQYLITQAPASRHEAGKFEHLYSNASYTMASAMLERVSGYNYESLVNRTLHDDLGLSVHIGWPSSFNPEQPWGHLISKNKLEIIPPDHEYKLPYLIAPAGDLCLSPIDYASYTQLHLKGLRGEDNYISSKGYQYIHFSHDGFSLGVANGILSGIRFSAFDGSAGTFFCRTVIVPDSDMALNIMMNAGSGTSTMKAIDWLTIKIIKQQYNWWWKFWL